MPDFLQLVRLELYSFLTRRELNNFQAVCSQWREEISRRSHLLARLYPGHMSFFVHGTLQEGSPIELQQQKTVKLCDQLDCFIPATRLVGERLFPHEDADRCVKLSI